MAFDRVRSLKIEKPSTGGTQTDIYPSTVNTNEDALDVRGLVIQNDTSDDENVIISRDASDNMTFKDGVVSGEQTLSDLLEGGDDDQVKDNVPDGETFTVKDEHQHIIYNEFRVAGEYIVNGESVIIGGDEGSGGLSNHDLGGTYHNSATLAELNAKISDATLDDSSDARTPSLHAATHESGMVDEISVAGLSGELADDQPTKTHDLAGAKHNSATLAELNAKVSDATLDDSSSARTPTSHASTHQSGGADSIKLDDFAAPDDNTDLNTTTSAHGLCPKLGGGTTNYLRADGNWADPVAGISFEVFSGYDDSGGTTIGGTYTDVPLDGEHKKTSGFTHSTSTNPEEVTIEATGTYKIDAQVTTNQTSDASRSETRMRLMLDTGSGYAEIPGTIAVMYNRDTSQGATTGSVSIIRDFDADDKIKVQAITQSGSGGHVLLADGSRLTITKL